MKIKILSKTFYKNKTIHNKNEDIKQNLSVKKEMNFLDNIEIIKNEDFEKANITFEEYLKPTEEAITKFHAYQDSLVNQQKKEDSVKKKQ